MVEKKDLIKITDVTWEIPTSYREDMRVPVRIFADEALIDAALGDKSFDQAVNTTTLPGLVSPVVVMPDVHQGYGSGWHHLPRRDRLRHQLRCEAARERNFV